MTERALGMVRYVRLGELVDPQTHWKAETLSFLHVLLVWGVNLASLLNKWHQSWTIHSKQTFPEILARAHKKIPYGTVRLIASVLPQIEGKFIATPGGLTSVFYGCINSSLWSELVNAIIKKVMAPLEVDPEFAFN